MPLPISVVATGISSILASWTDLVGGLGQQHAIPDEHDRTGRAREQARGVGDAVIRRDEACVLGAARRRVDARGDLL
jgi:hypothetical protein